jgi:hypothetical protein
MPERTNGTASKAVEVLRASVGSNPTPSAFRCEERLPGDAPLQDPQRGTRGGTATTHDLPLHTIDVDDFHAINDLQLVPVQLGGQ